MTVTAAEAAIAVARCYADEGLSPKTMLQTYLEEGVDPIAVALAACRLVSIADRRLTEMYSRSEGAWLNTIALNAERRRG